MSPILYFLLWAGFIFIMMRFGCGAHVMGHGRHGGHGGHGDRDETPAKATDPVCGMTVETAKAKSSVYQGRIYHFCSANCRDKFEAAPEQYAKGGATTEHSRETHHDAH